MKNTVSVPIKQSQLNNILNDNYPYEEPNIRKAQFIRSLNRIYTLEFDQNIEMQELKIMIQKAAHLKKNTFSLYCEGEDYTQYNDETFDSLFPEQNLVTFTLELVKDAEDFDETELLLQINMPCPEHDYKFLLYYCFDCGKSICSECFTNGPHKGHKIQDKCFYLLQSKYLVEKMFENWSKKPYEDYQISVDLNEYKNNLNNAIFKNLFQMLEEVKQKCNNLIDKYNSINQNSLSNIRDSVRDIKISCIKALDEYKDLINIKDIINNQEVFVEFDHIYKDMGKKQKEKFKENLLKFQELNKTVSIFVENLINDICEMIKNTLIKAIDDKQYIDIEQKIDLKLIKPVNKDDIINQLSDKKIRNKKNKKFERKTINNYNKLIGQISEGIGLELAKNQNNNNNNKGRNTISSETIHSLNDKEMYNNNDIDIEQEQLSNGKINNINNMLNNNTNNINRNLNNYSIDSTLKKPVGSSVYENNNENKNNVKQILNNSNNTNTNNNTNNTSNNKFINDFNQNNNNSFISNQNPNEKTYSNFNASTNINQSFGPNNIIGLKNNNDNTDNNKIQINNNEQNKNNINENPFIQPIRQNAQIINDNNINQNGKEINNNLNDKKSSNIFGSILDNNKNNDNNNNIFNTVSNKKTINALNIFSGNDISPIVDHQIINSNNGIFSNNSSFINDINNSNNSEQSNRDNIKMNMNMNIDMADNNNNNNNNQNPFLLNNVYNNNKISFNPNSNPQNITLSSPFTAIITNNNNNKTNDSFSNQDNNLNDNISSQNINNTNNINDKNKILTISEISSKYLAGLANNCKTILEEANESESDIKTQKVKKINIEYYLNKNYILCPIPTTNKLKIITGNENDENIMTITFPSNINISQFLYNCAHCNHNKKLYISGGIINQNSSPQLSTNIFYMIDLTKLNNNNNNNKNYASSCITELSSMIYSRTNHSMIGYNNEIFVVGGEDNNSVEKYDIVKDTWIEISSMIRKRSNAMLAIENEFLYVFFGKGEDGNYPESIERINITSNNAIFEMILYSNPNNIDTRLYGCGLFQVDGLIYFLGGKSNEKNIDEIYFFNFNDRRFDVTDSKLKWKESFRENQLFKLEDNIVQVCDGKFFGVYLKILVQ